MKTPRSKKRRIRFSRILMSIVSLIVLCIGYFVVTTYTYGLRTAHSPAQAAIVLGAAAWGEKPSPVFRERINHAIALYRSGKVKKLLFTGGFGKGSKVAESEVARRYAIRQGVPDADILTENRSRTTLENLRYAQQVARRHQLHSFLIVSDPLHMKRAMAMANDIGLQAKPSPTPTTRYRTLRSQWGMLMHETYFYVGYRLQHPL
jgi:uncharacterized SAM-binding protein YcdF (DUF218 family)